MKTITLSSIKGIANMKFTLPDNSGVFLIAGENGIGKTTLLVCLERICNNYAFAKGFASTSSWTSADQYTDARVKYEIDGDSIIYKKKKAKWAPTPRNNNAKFLEKYGFSSSVFIRADSRRIDIKQDDLRAGNFTSVDKGVKEALNEIFETKKYDRLQRLKNSNGKGRGAVFFYVIREGGGVSTSYYSEKRFSTGELAIVRLVEQVEKSAKGTMILLDEAELALHPRVQVKLLEYLRNKSIEKDLWFFISTHSPTMLKAAKKEEIILLRKDGEETEVINPCYPAQAIGDIDYAHSNIFDYIFFVEDEMAQTALRYLREKYIELEPNHATALCDIIPVGGFYETARLAVNTSMRLFGDSKVFAVVDHDAFEGSDNNPKFKKLYDENKKIIKDLGFTPEVYFISALESADEVLNRNFLNMFNIEIKEILQSEEYKKCNSTKIRQRAKDQFEKVIKAICLSAGLQEQVAIDFTIKMLIENMPLGEVKKTMGPLFQK